jgi:hypothetical protein
MTEPTTTPAVRTQPAGKSLAATRKEAAALKRAAKATPAKATPAKATPAKATPAKATPAKATPAKATPAKATPAKATRRDSLKAPVPTDAAGLAQLISVTRHLIRKATRQGDAELLTEAQGRLAQLLRVQGERKAK